MEYAFIEAISLHYFNLYFKESFLKAIFPRVNYITHDNVKKIPPRGSRRANRVIRSQQKTLYIM